MRGVSVFITCNAARRLPLRHPPDHPGTQSPAAALAAESKTLARIDKTHRKPPSISGTKKIVPPPRRRSGFPRNQRSRWMPTAKRGARPVDVLVGHNIRICRMQQGLSQTDLADRIGLTFQQIQKYETG